MKMVSANDLHYVDTDSLDWAPDPTKKRKSDPRTPTNTTDGSLKKRKTGNTPKAAIPLDGRFGGATSARYANSSA